MMRFSLRLFPGTLTRRNGCEILTARSRFGLEHIESYVPGGGLENQRIQKRAAMQTGILQVAPGYAVYPQPKRSLRHKYKI